ncbi:CtsR family transcriptional regulator, partial [Streptococcus sanguinis]|nr:CtsR family transcriptional regulator [Streptococcus sanguinis]
MGAKNTSDSIEAYIKSILAQAGYIKSILAQAG